MNIFAWFACLFFLFALVAKPCASVELTCKKFANTFVEDEAVTVNVSTSGLVTLIDDNGKVVLTKERAGKLDFGRLSPGYYEIVAGDTKLPIVVLINPDKRVKGDSAAAVDNAMSWLVPEEDFDNFARILRLTGITCVRERLTWGEVANPNGTYDFGKYVRSADALAKQGIKVYQIFHDSPGWARKDGVVQAVPDDLRVANRFGKAFAKQFKGKVFAWEFWNEPDGSFFYHTSTECAALQKAIYLGAKSVNPLLRILGPSIVTTTPFETGLLENDAAWYMDVWNYHVYAATEEYQPRAEHFRKVLAGHGFRKPMWITEAGDPFAEGLDGVLSGDMLRHQARFISRAFAEGIASGNERFFYFVFPFYREEARGWGVFGPDNKYPYPGLAAMSNATYALGKAKYIGTVDTGATFQKMMVFDRGDGTVCVTAWQTSETPSMMRLPISWSVVKEARDYLGRLIPRLEGRVKLNIGYGAVFFVVKSKDLCVKYIKPKPAPKLAEVNKPELTQIIPRLVYPKSVTYVDHIKSRDAYLVDINEPVVLAAQVYNFGTKPILGDVTFKGGNNCEISPKSVKCSVMPGEFFETPIAVKVNSRKNTTAVSMVVRCNGRNSSRASINLSQDPDLIPLLQGYSIDSDKPENWNVNIVNGAKLTIEPDPDSGTRFISMFPPNTDCWTYPQTIRRAPMELSGYDALQFEYKTGISDKGIVRAMVIEENGSYYILADLPCSEKWRLATVLFDESWQMDIKKKSMDKDKIVQISLGANSETQSFTLSVRNLRAVKL